MRNKVVLIHGWSATSSSMLDLRAYLSARGFTVADVWLGDYVSMDDDVRIEDVAKRMQRVLRGDGDRLGKRYDMIVHSTGGLVAREWLSQFYPDGLGTAEDPCPVRRLLMLAPANFGSKLASSGKSLIGRVAKGWDNWFHTGAEMLTELELASPYVWNLARRDLISPDGGQSPYGAGRVLPFVIAGTRGYREGLQQVVNENGSDGTVRPCAANLNARGYTVDFRTAAAAPKVTLWAPKQGAERTAFTVLPDRDHGTILAPAKDSGWTSSGRLGELIMAALECEDAGYAALCDAWDAVAEETTGLAAAPAQLAAAFRSGVPDPQELHQYMQVVVLVRDDDGTPVGDFFLEFYCPEVPGEQDSVDFHRDVLDDVHTNGAQPSRRCLFVDRSDLEARFYVDGRTEVAVSISAAPIGANVHYFDSTAEGAKGQLVVHAKEELAREQLPGRLRRNETHLVEIVIPRRPTDGVFRLTN